MSLMAARRRRSLAAWVVYGNAFLAMAAILVTIAELAWLLPAHDDTTLDARADEMAERLAARPT